MFWKNRLIISFMFLAASSELWGLCLLDRKALLSVEETGEELLGSLSECCFRGCWGGESLWLAVGAATITNLRGAAKQVATPQVVSVIMRLLGGRVCVCPVWFVLPSARALWVWLWSTNTLPIWKVSVAFWLWSRLERLTYIQKKTYFVVFEYKRMHDLRNTLDVWSLKFK